MVREVVKENQKVEGLLKRHLGAGAQISSIAHSLGEDAHNLQHLQSLPQRSAVHPEFLCEFSLRGKLASRADGPGRYKPLDLFKDLGCKPSISGWIAAGASSGHKCNRT